AVSDRLDQKVAESLSLELKLAQHVEDLAAQRGARLFQLLQERAVDVAFAGLFGHEIPEVANLRLADTVDASEPLLDAVRVPRQVVVHHQVRALEVDALARRIRRQKHLDLRVVPERLLRLHPLLAAHTAMNDDDGLLAAEERGAPALARGQGV